MRIKRNAPVSDYKILVVDDEVGIIDSLGVVLQRNGYHFAGETNPLKAIERIREEHFDLLVLDFLMHPLHGDEVVEQIRQFNKELYILLLTGYRDLAPPLETIRALDIQGYCEKSDKFDQLILLVESGIKSISMMRMIKKFQEGLNKILQAVPKIYQLQPLGSILEEVLSEIMPLVNSEHAFILIDDIMDFPAQSHQSIFKGIGKYKAAIDDFMEMLDPELFESVGHSRMNNEIVHSTNGVILPLRNELLQTLGVIYVESGSFTASPADEGLQLLQIYANQAASSLNNALLHSMVNMKNDELNKTYDELKTRYMDTIEALRLVVDAKDIYTRGHSDRVAYYAVEIGKAMNLPADQLELLRISGFFHDVGKIGTADDILSKSDVLDRNEFDEIKKHPLKGAHILSAVSMFKDVVPIVQCHHERIDGNGYPQGLVGNQIPLMSKIISVADAFDAMTSDRQYRKRLDLDGARRQLEAGMGSQFDGEIVKLFSQKLEGFHHMMIEMEEMGISLEKPVGL